MFEVSLTSMCSLEQSDNVDWRSVSLERMPISSDELEKNTENPITIAKIDLKYSTHMGVVSSLYSKVFGEFQR